MPIVEADAKYMASVLKKLTNNPTSQDLDFLIEAHARIGYLASEVQAEAEFAYAVRKNAEADAWKKIMTSGEKTTAAAAEKYAELEVWDLRQAEIEANKRSKKINNLLQSITEAINGVKFLGRLGG